MLLTQRLRQQGLNAVDWGYPWHRSVDFAADLLAERLREMDADDDVGVIHLVAHSMGGIVCRAALSRYCPRKIGRMVLLAAPNRGAPAAERWVRWGVHRWLPALDELSTRPDSYVNRLACEVQIPVGVIYARWDEIVKRDSAMFPGAADEITIAGTHASILFSRKTARCVAEFLSAGRLSEADAPVAGESDCEQSSAVEATQSSGS